MNNFLTEVYKDLASPSLKTVGDALDQAVSLILLPPGRLLEIFKNNLLKFINKLDEENPDNIVPPDSRIAMPIIDKMRYTEEEIINEKYTELLKNNCLKQSRSKVLPTYCDMLSKLTSDEVQILDYIKNNKYPATITKQDLLDLVGTPDFTDTQDPMDKSIVMLINGIPFLEVRDKHKQKFEWITVCKYFNDINDKVKITNPDNIELYFDNLSAVGLFSIKTDFWFIPITIYSPLEKMASDKYKKNIEKASSREIALIKGQIDLTALADAFLDICTRSNRE